MFSKKDFTKIEGIMMLHALKMHMSKRNAAKYLGVSLDTMDKYIRILEEELEVKLVISGSRGCLLTLAGEELVRKTEVIKQCLRELDTLGVLKSKPKGIVYVAYDQQVRGNINARPLKLFFSKYPEITLSLDSFCSQPNIKDECYDVCLSYDMPRNDGLVVIYSREIPCKFFASKEYLKFHSVPENMEDLLENHRLILCKSNWNGISEYAKQFHCKGISFTNSSFVVNDVAVNGGGIAVMPYYSHKLQQGLVCLDNLQCNTVKTIYLISHKERKDIPKVRAVLDYYKEMLMNL